MRRTENPFDTPEQISAAMDEADDQKNASDKLHILRHSLGLLNGQVEYRNHFVTGPGSTDWPIVQQLVDEGLMAERPGSDLTGGDPVFVVTDLGRQYAYGSRVFT